MQSDILNAIIGGLLDDEPHYAMFISITKFECIYIKDTPMSVRWTGKNLLIQYDKDKLELHSPLHRRGILKHEFAHYFLRHFTLRRYNEIEEILRSRFTVDAASIRNMINICFDLEINSSLLSKNELPGTGVFASDYQLPDGLLAQEYARRIDSALCGKSHCDLEIDEMMDNIQEADLDQRMEASLSQRGKIPAGLARLLKKLKPPTIKWPPIFRHEIVSRLKSRNNIPTYSKLNRRGLMNIAGSISKRKPDIFVIQDTSGSISEDELSILSSELFGIKRHANSIQVFVCDAAVHCRYKFNGKIESVQGGGGSDFRPAFDLIYKDRHRSKPLVVLLTDGDVKIPSECSWCDVVWVLCGKDVHVPFGRKILLR